MINWMIADRPGILRHRALSDRDLNAPRGLGRKRFNVGDPSPDQPDNGG